MKEHINNKLSVREEFEAWFESEMHESTFQRKAKGDYEEGYVDYAWEGYQAALSAVPAQEPVYLWRQKHNDNDNPWIDGSKELHVWMSKDKKYDTRVLYEAQQPAQADIPEYYCTTCEQQVIKGCGDSACQYKFGIPKPENHIGDADKIVHPAQEPVKQEPYAYDVPTEDGTELAYAIYFTKYGRPLPEGEIPLYLEV
jgi:hypothetical protein